MAACLSPLKSLSVPVSVLTWHGLSQWLRCPDRFQWPSVIGWGPSELSPPVWPMKAWGYTKLRWFGQNCQVQSRSRGESTTCAQDVFTKHCLTSKPWNLTTLKLCCKYQLDILNRDFHTCGETAKCFSVKQLSDCETCRCPRRSAICCTSSTFSVAIATVQSEHPWRAWDRRRAQWAHTHQRVFTRQQVVYQKEQLLQSSLTLR